MHSGDPSASLAGDTLAVTPNAADFGPKTLHLDRGDVLASASNADPNTHLVLEQDDAGTAENLNANLQRGDSVNVGSEIGELLEGGLGDAERIGAELAELSAELGLLAGLADSDHLHDLFDVPRMKQRDSASSRSSSSSTTWSGARGGRAPRTHARPARPARRRAIAKLKEGVRRRCAAAGPRRALDASQGWRSADAASDVSDVGADSDSDDDWWTECSSESSSVKEGGAAAGVEFDCNGYEHKPQDAEAPPMGQFLLPLLSPSEPPAAPPADHFLIRHEDILQFLASAEENNLLGQGRTDSLTESAAADAADAVAQLSAHIDEASGVDAGEASTPVTPEEEAAVLRYVCEAERQLSESEWRPFAAVEDWLLGVYHSWCEISALMYTMLGAANAGIDYENWLYRAHFSCHCRLCVCRAYNAVPLERHIDRILISLARGEKTMRDALTLMHALNLRQPGAALQPHTWDLSLPLHLSNEGLEMIRQCLEQLTQESELTRELLETGCVCRPRPVDSVPVSPMDILIDILERFKAAFYTTFRVEMLSSDGSTEPRLQEAARCLSVHLQPYQRSSVCARLHDLTANQRLHPETWPEYRCDCLNPRVLNPTERKQLLRISFYSLRAVVGVGQGCGAFAKPPHETDSDGATRELQQANDICPKPPEAEGAREVNSEAAAEADRADAEKTPEEALSDGGEEWDEGWDTRSLSSLDSASQLLLAAAAVESEAAPGELCRTVRHLMKSIASIEVLMDRVLQHCSGVWPLTEPDRCSARVELLEVDRKLMAMYRRLPEVHQKQLQVYRNQKKLSSVCMHLVGGRAPPPPPPGSPPPSSPACPPAVCPEYHLRRFKEVKRKVLHMRDQQLYYHRLRLWLEEQLRRDKPEGEAEGHKEEGDEQRHRLRHSSPRLRSATSKRKLWPHSSPSLLRPRGLLHALKGNTSHETKIQEACMAVEKAVAETFFDRVPADTLSDTDTIVDKGEELCSEVKECVARFANFALDAPDMNLNAVRPDAPAVPPGFEIKQDTSMFPDGSLSPPLQDLSPTCSEPLPVYHATHKPNQRLITVNKLLSRSANMLDRLKEDICSDFGKNPTAQPDLLNFYQPSTRRMSLLVEEMVPSEQAELEPQPVKEDIVENIEDSYEARARALLEQFGDFKMSLNAVENAAVKDPRVHKYVEFGLEIKRAIEECQNIINSCNSYIKVTEGAEVPQVPDQPPIAASTIGLTIKDVTNEVEPTPDPKDETSLSFDQIYEAIMSLDKSSTDILECMDRNTETNEPVDFNVADTKLAALVENMPQILANMPEIATKLSEFANVSFELPEFASMLNSLPEVNSDAQLTPETLKQIRELKISKARDGLKVTKHTTKRKTSRKVRSNTENDIIGTITFDIDSKDISDMLRDEKELRSHLKNKNCSKEDYKDLLFSVSAQVVTNKVYEYVKQNSNPELAKCSEYDEELLKIREMIEGCDVSQSEMCTTASALFDNSVKVALSMNELRQLVESRFNSWKNYVAAKFKNIPMQVLEDEIENMLGKFYTYIEDLAEKQNQTDCDKIPEKLDQAAREDSQEEGAKALEAAEVTSLEECQKHEHDKSNACDCLDKNKPCEMESLKQIMKFIKDSVGSTFDIILMQTSKMTKDSKNSVKNIKFKYMDVIRRCAESSELVTWILLDPEVAANVILEMTGLAPKPTIDAQDFTNYTSEKRCEYFMKQLHEMNRVYMNSLPKNSFTGDEWLVILYRLEQLENKLKQALTKAAQNSMKPAQTQTNSHISETREAELVAGKGLSKIINQANKKKPVSNTTASSSTETPSPKSETPKVPEKPPSTPADGFLGFQLYKQSTSTANTVVTPSGVEPKPCVEEVKPIPKTEIERKQMERNDALLAKCEAILTSKGEKSLLDSFYTIKSYITSGQPVPESYKKHVIKICSSIDSKLLDGDIEETLAKAKAAVAEAKAMKPHDPIEPVFLGFDSENKPSPPKPPEKCTKADQKPAKSTIKQEVKCCSDDVDSGSSSPAMCCPTKGKHFAIIGSQNPELLAKYSAQALRNAKQSLNAVAFNSIRNGSKPKEEETTAPKSDCKWTNDCICNSCRGEGNNAICLGDIVKQCYDIEKKAAKPLVAETGKPVGKAPVKDVKPVMTVPQKLPPAKGPAKPALPKVCENIHPQGHQQHVCKMGHTTAGAGCANENQSTEQPCNCCYCTVFGHAPPMTTPVPRNFNETRERLRSILNRKKQKSSKPPVANERHETPESQKTSQPSTPETVQNSPTTAQPQKPSAQAPNIVKQPQAKVPPLRPSHPGNQNVLAEQMAKMILSSDGQDKKEVLASNVTPQIKPNPIKTSQPPQQQTPRVTSRPHSPRSPPYPPRPLSHQDKENQQALEKAALQQKVHIAIQQHQQRQSRPQQQRQQSFSSRDTSVFSTSSGCSAVSGWRDGCVSDDGCGHIEDTRDLDALLQYIEGPARLVDRGKKKAKKQRQKAKKMESKLIEEQAELSALVALRRHLAKSLRLEHHAAKRRLDESRQLLKQHQQQGKKKGKKGKVTPSQQANMQLAAEQHGAYNMIYSQTLQALHEADAELEESTQRLAACEAELREVRALQSSETRGQSPRRARPAPPPRAADRSEDIVRVRRSPGDGAVNVSLNQHTIHHVQQVFAPTAEEAKETPKKQSWEAALAHINALATQPLVKPAKENKPKKVSKEAPARSEQTKAPKQSEESSRSQSLTDQPLSKKQRRLLARQQAEEEEARCKREEAKLKKEAAKKSEQAAKRDAAARKPEEVRKSDGKKEAGKRKEEAKSDCKAEKEKKGKDNKATNTATSTKQQKATITPASSGKSQKSKPHLINITPDTTLQLLSSKGGCLEDSPSACSIMDQLNCGVQVADLRLPPGITLTRVPPSQQPTAPAIKSVPLWKSNTLAAAPTPPQRPQPIINADPSLHTHSILEPPKASVVPDAQHTVGKSKKAKKKAKKAAAAAESHPKVPTNVPHADSKKNDGTKMVTLRNPMFHPNLPPVQVSTQVHSKKLPEQIRIPDPIPMPPNACQATITPTSNGMYTIRNPLMSMVHQQSMMGVGSQNPNPNPHLMAQQPSFASAYVVNQNHFNAMPPPAPHAQYVMEPQISPQIERKHFIEERQPEFRRNEYQNPNSSARIMNLASFTQKNDEGYSLFKPSQEEPSGRTSAHFEQPNYQYDNGTFARRTPNPIVSPNPIGTRPEPRYEPNDASFFTTKRPEPIGTPLTKREEERNDFGAGLYTPFGQTEDRDFRSALFQTDRGDERGSKEDAKAVPNGDTLPYFQRLRVGARLNNEVTIHHVTESKFFKPGSEPPPHAPTEPPPDAISSSVFRTPYTAKTWTPGLVSTSPSNSSSSVSSAVDPYSQQGYALKSQVPHSAPSSLYDSVSNSSSNSPQTNDNTYRSDAPEEGLFAADKEELVGGFGAIGRAAAPIGSQRMINGLRQNNFYPETSVFAPDRTVELSELDSSERDIESFKRFDFYFEPPKNKPKIALNLHDITSQLKPKDK